MAELLERLKQRKLVQWTLAYLAGAWLILQVIDVAREPWGLSSGLVRAAQVSLAIGLLIALVVAWYHGEKGRQRVSGPELLIIAGILLLAGLLVPGFFASEGSTAQSLRTGEPDPAQEPSPPSRSSIAVLPFANLSENSGHEHFAGGLTEELMNALAAIDELRVISRMSSFAIASRNLTTSEIASTLGVAHVLAGSVQAAGNRIRVTAQLFDTRSDSQLWSDRYEEDLSLENILDIQDQIALEVADALELVLLPQESESPAATAPDNLAALELYHEGLFHLRQLEIGAPELEESFEAAVETLEASIAADPGWAQPRAALGRVYHFWHALGGVGDMAERMAIAKRHVLEAIRLDDEYGPAYASLAYILTMAGDYDGAMQALDRARSLNVDAFDERAILLRGLGRFDEAISEYRNAVNHDPLSVLVWGQLVGTYGCAGRYAEMRTALESGRLDSSVYAPIGKALLAEAYVRTGDVERGLSLAAEVEDEIGTNLYVATSFALAGHEDRARAALDSRSVVRTDDLLRGAAVAAALGEEDRALTMLEDAFESASNEAWPFWVLFRMQCSPEIRGFAGNPRYEALLDRLGLPD